MYDRLQIEGDKLLAISDKGRLVRVMNVNEISKEIILVENKIEEYENEINKQLAKKNKLLEQDQNNCFILKITTILMLIIVLTLAGGAIIFMPLSSLITNIGLIITLVTFIGGGIILNKADDNRLTIYHKMKNINKLISYLENELTNAKRYKRMLESEPSHMKNKNNSNDTVELENSYNEELKNCYLDCRDEILAFKQLVQNCNEFNDDMNFSGKEKTKVRY